VTSLDRADGATGSLDGGGLESSKRASVSRDAGHLECTSSTDKRVDVLESGIKVELARGNGVTTQAFDDGLEGSDMNGLVLPNLLEGPASQLGVSSTSALKVADLEFAQALLVEFGLEVLEGQGKVEDGVVIRVVVTLKKQGGVVGFGWGGSN